jgi:threonine dehydrogenase-like Zn-dependent dehydrogenase
MKACVLTTPRAVETSPLIYRDVPCPQPTGNEVLIRVRTCGICRTDLHLVEGELPRPQSSIIPGHQIVGTVEEKGERSTRFAIGARVGMPWLHRSCGTLRLLRSGGGESVRQCAIYRQHGEWRLCGIHTGTRGLPVRTTRWRERSTSGAPPLRWHYRISVAAPFGCPARRVSRYIRLWRSRSRRDSNCPALENVDLRLHA